MTSGDMAHVTMTTMTMVIDTRQQQFFRGGNEPVSCAAAGVATRSRLKSNGVLNGSATRSGGGGSEEEEEGSDIRNDVDLSSSGDIGSSSSSS
mmetsp:Transcript_24284/g.44653  ORF Transcript_24284/g.44653 Transcript_24284/m.44653 type:complete len:93 (+) Transcript_24284:258-536(+)|eukprot:CAMPEP_0201875452 /NCGR_PEP_ID=MMETSP0902-20130614/7429_1 /ASSEMBLY_ACC=CAM_ASM_000551 /TAXON_ID=420261 /ORGANISM="Thalassiosira antarctica, Strain CCMP982" /LENGTH=92 /DNA_ID=CAMNT_0048402515 /DNA_START=112 /DNA_END=390 /DNA_ORIENTATION=-